MLVKLHIISTYIKTVTDPKVISAPSVAVWEHHVVFIEYVEYDTNGNPSVVYFSEANYGNDGTTTYRQGIDGVIKKDTYTDFINRSNTGGKLLGYIVPAN